MSDRSSKLRVVAAVLLGVVLGSCDKSPTAPRPGTGLTVVRVEITAPSSIAPGQSVQLAARGIRSEGSSADITTSSTWSTSNAAVLQVTQGGVATAIGAGEAIVSARHLTLMGSTRVLALAPGTFKLSGQITESGFPIGGTAVHVLSGTGQGLATTTDSEGNYALYGVAGRVRLSATRAGYFSKTEEVDVLEHFTFNFELTPEGGRPNLNGPYTLLIIARCGSSLPTDLTTRTYAATIEQRGPGLTVTLSGADFIISKGRGDRFQGMLEPDGRITFTIGDPLGYRYYGFYNYSYPFLKGQPDLAERIAPSGALVINGTVDAALGGSRINGTLSGAFLFTDEFTAAELTPATTFNGTCFSSNSAFQMRRH